VSGVGLPIHRQRRLAIAPNVIADDPEVTRQHFELMVPVSAITCIPVNQHEYVARSGHFIVEAPTWDFDIARLHLNGRGRLLTATATTRTERCCENGGEDGC